ncbi:membrane protein YpdK [Erwinia oleae]
MRCPADALPDRVIQEWFVKYALMGISFILLVWAGTFYLML